MSISQSQFDSLVREVRSIKKMLKNSTVNDSEDWVPEEEAIRISRLSKKSLQQYRAKGIIKKWKALPSGRKPQYSKTELEKIFIHA